MTLETLESRLAPAIIPVAPGMNTLSAAVAEASSGDVLSLSAGTYSLTSEVVVSKTLTIEGQGPTLTGITANRSGRDFEIVGNGGASVTVVFKDLTITGAEASNGGMLGLKAALGGGLLIDSGQVTLSNVAVESNAASGTGGRLTAVGAPGASGQAGGNGGNGSAGSRGRDLPGSRSTDPAGGHAGGRQQGTGGNGRPGRVGWRETKGTGPGGAGGNGGLGGSAAGGGIYQAGGQLIVMGGKISDNVALGGFGGNGHDGGYGGGGLGLVGAAGGAGGNGGLGGRRCGGRDLPGGGPGEPDGRVLFQ